MKKKFHNIYITYYNLLIVQDLWRSHHQILSIIFLKKFIKLNGNMDTMKKKLKLLELHIKYATAFLNTQTLKMINRIKMFIL